MAFCTKESSVELSVPVLQSLVQFAFVVFETRTMCVYIPTGLVMAL